MDLVIGRKVVDGHGDGWEGRKEMRWSIAFLEKVSYSL